MPTTSTRSPVWIIPGLVILWAISYLFMVIVNPLTIERPGQVDIVPPGWEWVDDVVGYVWFLLLSLMVGSRWLVLRSGRDGARYYSWVIVGYIGFCFSYIFTFGLTPETGVFGNIITIFISTWLGIKVMRFSRISAVPILASTVWVSIAAVYLSKMLGLL